MALVGLVEVHNLKDGGRRPQDTVADADTGHADTNADTNCHRWGRRRRKFARTSME